MTGRRRRPAWKWRWCRCTRRRDNLSLVEESRWSCQEAAAPWGSNFVNKTSWIWRIKITCLQTIGESSSSLDSKQLGLQSVLVLPRLTKGKLINQGRKIDQWSQGWAYRWDNLTGRWGGQLEEGVGPVHGGADHPVALVLWSCVESWPVLTKNDEQEVLWGSRGRGYLLG